MSDESNIGDDRLAYPTGLVEKFARAMFDARFGDTHASPLAFDELTPFQQHRYRAMTIAGMRAIQNDWLWANVIEHAIREAEQK